MSLKPIQIRAYRAGDETGIVDCLNRTLEKPLSLEEWSWRFPLSPDGRPIMIAVRGGQVVAHVAVTRTRLQLDDEIVEAAAIGNGVVDPSVGGPEARKRLLADTTEALISECFESGRFDRVFFLGEHSEAIEWAAAMGAVAEDLPNVELLRRKGVSSRRIRRLAYRAESARDWEPRLEDLWQRARGAYPAALVRDADYSLARFSGHPTERYHRFLVFARFSHRPVAFAVFCCDEGTCRWIDLVWDHRYPGVLDLLSHVSGRLAHQVGAEVEEVGLAGDPEGRLLLGRLGFVDQPPTISVGLSVRAAGPRSDRAQIPDRFFMTLADLRSR